MSDPTDVQALMVTEVGITPIEAKRVIEAFKAFIRSSMKKGQDVTISSFGRFSVKAYAGRTGRNPRTGAAIKIKAKRVPILTLYRKTKDRLLIGQIAEYPWLSPEYEDTEA